MLPQGQALASDTSDMVLRRISWQPQKIFSFEPEESERAIEGEDGEHNTALLGSLPSALSGKSRNEAFRADFTSSVGGLQPQIDAIVRRVLDGRVIRPVEVVDRRAGGEQDETTAELTAVATDAEELALLGLTPVRGLLLYVSFQGFFVITDRGFSHLAVLLIDNHLFRDRLVVEKRPWHVRSHGRCELVNQKLFRPPSCWIDGSVVQSDWCAVSSLTPRRN